MVTTIGDLLVQADLTSAPAAPRGAHPEHLAAWTTLAKAALRSLDALPVATRGHPIADSTNHLRRLTRTPTTQGTFTIEPDPVVAAVALRLGLVADLLTDQTPSAVSAAQDSAAFQGRILGIVHAAGKHSLPALEPYSSGWLDLLDLIRATQPWARSGHHSSPPETPFDDIAAVTEDDPTLDGHLRTWRRAVLTQLDSQNRSTARGFQTIAADLAILSAISTVALDRLGYQPQDPAPQALAEAQYRWRALSRWPDGVTFRGARDPALGQASIALRDSAKALLRPEDRWVTAEELAAQHSPAYLLNLVRRVNRTTAEVADHYLQAIDSLVHGSRRLWVAGPDVSPPSLSGLSAHDGRHGGWVVLDQFGREAAMPLLRQSERARMAAATAHLALQSRAGAPFIATAHAPSHSTTERPTQSTPNAELHRGIGPTLVSTRDVAIRTGVSR